MTSTNINVGLDATNRLTSRVLKPPGGGHTDIFGPAEPEVLRVRKHQVSSIVLGTDNCNEAKPTNGDAPTVDSNENSTAPPPEEEVQKTETIETREESKPEVTAEVPKPEPPRRVRVPPGGFSSGLW